MRLIRTIETDIALTKRSLITPSLLNNRNTELKLQKLYTELREVKDYYVKKHNDEIKQRVYITETAEDDICFCEGTE